MFRKEINKMTVAEFSIEETKKKLNHYGMSYSDLAEQIDMQLSSLSQYLNNKLKIPKSAMIRIVMYFNIVAYQIELQLATEKITELESIIHNLGNETSNVEVSDTLAESAE